MYLVKASHPVDTERKLSVLCTFSLRPMSTGYAVGIKMAKKFHIKTNPDNVIYNILKYKVVLIEM